MPASRAISPGCGVSTSVRALCASLVSSTGFGGQNIERVGVDHRRNLRRRKQTCGEFDRLRTLPQAGSDSQHGFSSRERGKKTRRKILRRNLSRGICSQRPGHQLRRNGRHLPPAPEREPLPSPVLPRPATRAKAAMAGAPALPPAVPNVPPTTNTCPKPPLLAATTRGSCASASEEPAQLRFRPETIASSGEPMGATTIGCHQCRVSCPKTCAGLGAVKVMTASAGKTGPLDSGMRSRPPPSRKANPPPEPAPVLPSIHSSASSANPFSGGLNPVPTTASIIRSASRAALCRRQVCSRRRRCESVHAQGWSDSRHAVAASPLSPSRRAQQQRGHIEAGLSQQPRRHHAVAAVVAAPAQHRHPPRPRKLLPRECRHGSRGRTHQLDRWNPEPLGGQRGRRPASRPRKERSWQHGSARGNG